MKLGVFSTGKIGSLGIARTRQFRYKQNRQIQYKRSIQAMLD
jgi:hypothetical protein